MEKELIFIVMVIDITVTFKTVVYMVKEFFIGKVEINTKATG